MIKGTDELKKQFEECFENNLTLRQMWFIVKLAKLVRLRCRNNAAFNNAFNDIFGGVFTFREIIKTKPALEGEVGETYKGLEIVPVIVE